MMQGEPLTLAAIARPSGALAMVAMDQRESLRAMFADAGAGRVHDATLIDFKLAVADALAPLASGFLIDRHYGFDGIRADGLPSGCGLILAADDLVQPAGGPVEDTTLDELVFSRDFDRTGVAALKLLIIWRRDERRAERVELARRFVGLAAEHGLPSVLEPVVRSEPSDQDAAILEAARELSPLQPSLYKAQVPMNGTGAPAELERACAALGGAITGPWVVLSQGVPRDAFPAAVRAACRGGASGFLAGRALWSDIVGAADVRRGLAEVAAPRLERLVDLVDREAVPWHAA